jgi:hypothetical protein
MSEERRAEVRLVPVDDGDERRQGLARLNLLAMVRRSRARTEEQTRWIREESA